MSLVTYLPRLTFGTSSVFKEKEVAESADLRSEYSKEASCENIVGKRSKSHFSYWSDEETFPLKPSR